MDGLGVQEGGSFGMRKPLHAAPPIKKRWNQAIFEIVIGSLVTALYCFKFYQKKWSQADTTEKLVGERKDGRRVLS